MQYPDTDTRDYSDWLPESAFRSIKVEPSKESQESETSDDSNDSEESEDVKIPIKTETHRTPDAISAEGRLDGSLPKHDTSQLKLQEPDGNNYIRMPTVFDAVAGKLNFMIIPVMSTELTQPGLVGRNFAPLYDFSQISQGEVADRLKQLSRTKQLDDTFKKPLTPEEVLFDDSRAPARYEEYDIYFANERELPHGGRGVLPENDGLKAIHEYSSSSYTRPEDLCSASSTMGEPRSASLKSMDETALIAFGILMEESARHLLGRKGHEAFVVNENSDLEQEDEVIAETPIATPSPRVPSPVFEAQFKTEVDAKIEHGDVVDMAHVRPWNEEPGQSGYSRKKAKKRKVRGLQSLGSQDKRLMKGFKTR